MDIRPVSGFSTPQEPAESWWRKDRAMLLSGSLALLLLVGVAVGIYVGVARAQEAHTRFMRQCMEDHKEYECTALWRAGGRSGADLIVLPVPLPR